MTNYLTHYKSLLIAFFMLFVAGCAPKLEWYQTEINNPRTELEHTLKKGMPESKVVALLGIPQFQADLTKSRKIVRYYAEKVELEKREYGSSLTERVRYRVDIWYRKGKLVKVKQDKHEFRNIKGRSEPYYSLEDEDYYLHHPYVSTDYNMGMPFDYAKATKLGKGTPLPELLWQLGAPNRIVNSADGEIFVYENGFFETDIDQTAKVQSFESYNYAKVFFVVRNGIVTEQNHYSKSFDLSQALEEDNELAAELNLIFMFQESATKWLEYCLEETSGDDDECDPGHFRNADDYPEIKTLLYHTADLDFGDIKKGKRKVYQNILKTIEGEMQDPSVELLFVYRSAIPSAMRVGKSRLSDIFAGQKLKPYYQALNSDKGTLAKTWLNLGQPDKWYFNDGGKLVTGIHFSLIAPASPWYAYGPNSFDTSFDPVNGAACTLFSDNCLKPMEELYKYNIAVPEL